MAILQIPSGPSERSSRHRPALLPTLKSSAQVDTMLEQRNVDEVSSNIRKP